MKNIRPQDDFYMYKNGEWLENAQIPDDLPLTGSFVEILIRNEKTLMADLAKFAKEGVDPKVYDDQLFNRFMVLYQKALDIDQRIKDGNDFIKSFINQIDQVKTIADLEQLTKEFMVNDLPTLLPLGTYVDMKNAEKNTLYLSLPGIILPEKSYYDESSPTYQNGIILLQKFSEVMMQLFEIIGLENPQEIIKSTLEFDKVLVPVTKTAEEDSDYVAKYNPYSFDDLSQKIKPFNLDNIIKAVISEEVLEVIVTDPKYIDAFSEIVTNNLELIKAWLKTKVVFSLASGGYGTDDLRQISAQYSQLLTGQAQITSFEKYTYQSLSNLFGDIVGLYFGHRYFGAEAKKDIEQMVLEFIQVYQERLRNNTWLSKETIEKAISKLSKIQPMIGYPDEIHQVFKTFVPDVNKTYAENRLIFNKASVQEEFSQYNKKPNKKLWGMGAHIVNAYYNPNLNLIVFPAGILQYPFYDYNQPKGANYGGIGSVIAHEITHAFDTNGAKIDEFGNINNWWKEEDFKNFGERAEKMVELFDGLEIPGSNGKCNGHLTVTENIADSGGLSCAYEAGKNHPEFDLKDFFDGWAVIWRIKATAAYQDLLANIDVHAPGYLRAKIQLMNFEPFARYFDVKEGDGMYLDPKKYISIW